MGSKRAKWRRLRCCSLASTCLLPAKDRHAGCLAALIESERVIKLGARRPPLPVVGKLATCCRSWRLERATVGGNVNVCTRSPAKRLVLSSSLSGFARWQPCLAGRERERARELQDCERVPSCQAFDSQPSCWQTIQLFTTADRLATTALLVRR